MSESNGERTAVDEQLSLEPGTQALVTVDSMQSSLRHLPIPSDSTVLVVSSKHPSDLAEQIAAAGADLQRVGQIPISGASVDYEGPMWTTDSVVPDDLTGLSMRLSSAMESLDSDTGRLVFDGLNVFLLYASEHRVIRFLDYTTNLASEQDIRGYYTAVREAMDPETVSAVTRCFDVEFDRR